MEIKNVSFSYNHDYMHLNDINVTIEKGKITTIIGPNGSGKSTLLGVMAKNNIPLRGEIILDGSPLTSYKRKVLAQKIGIVHQQNIAPLDITVEKLVKYGRLPHKSLFSSKEKENQEAVQWALEETNLILKKDAFVHSLSGGERQRVWIAMALAQKTPYLFLDEPTTFLDIYHQYEILELVKNLNKNHDLTIVMVLHDINQALQYSDNIIVMKDGQVTVEGKTEEVITEQTILETYGIRMRIKKDNEIGIYMIPLGV